MANDLTTVDVLIVGAGPTGLTAGISLLAQGRRIAIVDRQEAGYNTSRAAVVYPRTLEALEPLGVSARLIGEGIRSPRFTIRDRDRVLMPLPFDHLPTGYAYALLVSQAVTEGVLLDRVKALGGSVLRPRTVTGLRQDDAGVTVTLADGARMRAQLVIGADGVHSTVRDEARIAFGEGARGASYSLADVHLSGGVPDDELVVYFSPAGHLVVLPLPEGIHRIVAQVEEAPEQPDKRFLQALLDRRGPERERAVVREVVWGSRFLTRHAIASRYCAGRIALAGDAAHTHSPLAGQGMNLGINDAALLGPLVSRIIAGGSLELLERYEASQREIASKVISVTDLLTNVATMCGRWRRIRNTLVAALSPIIRERLAWRLSLLSYFDAQAFSTTP